MGTNSKMASKTTSPNFRDLVYGIVKKIPDGKVATYGQIAKKLETRNLKLETSNILAMAVGNALHQNIDPSIPCHRVVDRNGRVAPHYGFGGANEQRRRLLTEGVRFVDNMHVDLSQYLWKEEEGSTHLTGEKHPARKWSDEIMAGALMALKENGEPINVKYLGINHPALFQAIRSRPGGWAKMVTMAGYDPLLEAKGNFGPRFYVPEKSSH